MANITDEMRMFFEEQRDPKMIFIGTCDKNGIPNVAAKGVFVKLLDTETLVYADVYSVKTLENVLANPKIAIAIINAKTFKGYQFKGTAEVVKEGPLLEAAKKATLPQLPSVTVVKIEAVYLMDYGHEAGKKLI